VDVAISGKRVKQQRMSIGDSGWLSHTSALPRQDDASPFSSAGSGSALRLSGAPALQRTEHVQRNRLCKDSGQILQSGWSLQPIECFRPASCRWSALHGSFGPAFRWRYDNQTKRPALVATISCQGRDSRIWLACSYDDHTMKSVSSRAYVVRKVSTSTSSTLRPSSG
jgi:hypothetical protein